MTEPFASDASLLIVWKRADSLPRAAQKQKAIFAFMPTSLGRKTSLVRRAGGRQHEEETQIKHEPV